MRPISNISTRISLILSIVWIGTLTAAFSQEGIPFFRNFTADEYRAHNRNFDVVCDSSGIVYFANFEGIIYYNGAEWHKILTPGISRITRLYIDANNRIWAGGHNYIGRIESGNNGTPQLRSYISDQENNERTVRIGEVSDIQENSGALLFSTPNFRITIQGDSITALQSVEAPEAEKISRQSLRLSDRWSIAIHGTDGLILTNSENDRPLTINDSNGLCSNMINRIATDHKGTVWAATDNGVFAMYMPAFYSRFTSHEGLKGEVTALYRHNRELYAGTLHGLFRYDTLHTRFEPFPLITQSCWQLQESPAGDLYAVTSNGLFRIEGKQAKAINYNNTFSLTFDPSDPQTLYTGEIDGIYQIKGGKKTKIAEIEKAMKLIFSANRLWVETLYGELYRFNESLASSQLMDSIQGLKAVGGNKLYLIGEEIHALSRYGFQKWAVSQQRFEPPVNLPEALAPVENWWPGLYASTPSGQEGWVIGGDGKNPVVFQNGQIDWKKSELLSPIKNYVIRTLYLENGQIAWIGGDFGLIKFDLGQADASFRQKPEVHIRSIRLGNDSIYLDSPNQDLKAITTLPEPRFGSSIKNFTFSFSSEANGIISPVRYAYYLQGYETSWSPWQTLPRREYTNLSYGTYTFRVKALDAFGRESDETNFSFTILKPFYLKWYSLLAYLAALVLLILLFFKWRTRKLRQEKMRLETIVEQRTKQIREQRDEIAEKSQKLEIALKDLREAQDQLIRQEKVTTVAKLTQGLIDRILNPLNYIINFSHLSTVLLKDMKEDIEDEEENITEDNYEDMQDILQMLHTHLSKIEEHGNSTSRILKAMEEMLSDHSCHFSETDINKLAESNLNILKEYYQKEIQTSAIRITFKALDKPQIMEVDQLQLGKALMSMMLNSIHALQKKKAKGDYPAQMEIRLERQAEQVSIHLRDNGIGIEESILDKIFDPFFTTKTTSEAAGVGLYLSREIILSHNGSIQVKSEKDEYTEFILSLPIHQSLKSSNDE
ncbi:ATP-binding protein [Parabacteroides sp.]